MSEQAKATPYITTVEEGPAYWQVGILWVMLATGEQTGGEYSLMWELCPKGSGATPHYHDQDEQFYLIDGEITYLANGKELKAKAGSFVLIPRGTVHSFRVDSETATLLNSYTPAGFERTITELAEPAQARTIPPTDRPPLAADWETFANLYAEIGMHPVQEPDALRQGHGEAERHSAARQSPRREGGRRHGRLPGGRGLSSYLPEFRRMNFGESPPADRSIGA